MDSLDLDILHYHSVALAPSTLHSYHVALRSYQLFCHHAGVRSFPLDEGILQRFVASHANRLSFVIRHYKSLFEWSSVFFTYATLTSPVRISSMVRLFYLLRAIRRVQGANFRRPQRNPITVQHLHLICHRLQFLQYNNFQRLALWSAATTAFFGLLRCSEYTCQFPTSFNPSTDLRYSNVTISSNLTIMIIRIRASKTDPFRLGCNIRVGATGDRCCPVRAMSRYLSVHPMPMGPLFIFSSHRFITRIDIVNMLGRCLPGVPNINTHSFRIGGASAAASAGITDSTIQILGRWSSDAYRRYLRLSNASVMDLSIRMNEVFHTTRFWSQDSLSSYTN